MGRPPSITEDEVMAAARAVFLEKGIAGTTAEVAARCGVSEATVFRRFPTKGDLFRAAMVVGPPPWMDALPELAGRGDPRRTLIDLGKQVADFYRKAAPLLTMAMSNPTVGWFERRASLRRRLLPMVTGFFAAEIRAGRIRVRDAGFAARIFFGGIISFVLFDMMGDGVSEMPESVFLKELAELMCGPEEPAPRRTRPGVSHHGLRNRDGASERRRR
jgi:AcrR family transcriptional regulator